METILSVLTTAAFVAQAYKIIHTRETAGINACHVRRRSCVLVCARHNAVELADDDANAITFVLTVVVIL